MTELRAVSTEEDGVVLTWKSPATCDALRVTRNGKDLGSLEGERTRFVDTNAPAGVLQYRVVAMENGRESFPAKATIVR